ncbi:MAG: signal peptidase [Edaphobacter sp.]|nr:signal peptidase [Edaphobacter sp.]
MKEKIKVQQNEAKQIEETHLQGFASLCGTLAIGLFVLTFVFQNFVIPSPSMASTLLVGDHVMVERVTLAPSDSLASFMPHRDLQRDEPIVFYKPVVDANGEYTILVKRVIGVPGDRIHIRHGIVYRNGVAQHEPYAAQPTYANYDPYRDDFPSISAANHPDVTAQWSLDLPNHIQGEDLVVPPGNYFVMGDNRTNSLDGRFWGLVPRGNLIGRPLFVYWSFKTPEDQIYKTDMSERASFTLHQIVHIFDETRWSRTLHKVE